MGRVKGIGSDDVASRVENGFGGDLGAIEVLPGLDLDRELDVKSDLKRP